LKVVWPLMYWPKIARESIGCFALAHAVDRRRFLAVKVEAVDRSGLGNIGFDQEITSQKRVKGLSSFFSLIELKGTFCTSEAQLWAPGGGGFVTGIERDGAFGWLGRNAEIRDQLRFREGREGSVACPRGLATRS